MHRLLLRFQKALAHDSAPVLSTTSFWPGAYKNALLRHFPTKSRPVQSYGKDNNQIYYRVSRTNHHSARACSRGIYDISVVWTFGIGISPICVSVHLETCINHSYFFWMLFNSLMG